MFRGSHMGPSCSSKQLDWPDGPTKRPGLLNPCYGVNSSLFHGLARATDSRNKMPPQLGALGRRPKAQVCPGHDHRRYHHRVYHHRRY